MNLYANKNVLSFLRWRTTGSMWPWSSTGSSCGFLWQFVFWGRWDSSSSRSSASGNEKVFFVLFLSLSLGPLLSVSVLNLNYCCSSFKSNTELSSFSLSGICLSSLSHALLWDSLIVFSCLISSNDFTISSLPRVLNVHAVLFSNLLRSIIFSDMIIKSFVPFPFPTFLLLLCYVLTWRCLQKLFKVCLLAPIVSILFCILSVFY